MVLFIEIRRNRLVGVGGRDELAKLSLRCPNRPLKKISRRRSDIQLHTLVSSSINFTNNPTSLDGHVWGGGLDEIKGVSRNSSLN